MEEKIIEITEDYVVVLKEGKYVKKRIISEAQFEQEYKERWMREKEMKKLLED